MNCRNTKYILLAAGTTGGGDTTMYSESMLKHCIRENEGKNKIYCNCHSGWDKNLHVKVSGEIFQEKDTAERLTANGHLCQG